MKTAGLKQVVRQVRDLVSGQPADGASDAELLGKFASDRDEAAFEALLRRHGPMVLGVCRRVLRNDADAEDAFQATFLVLARRAASVGRPEALAGWLYGVAFRVASEARRAAARRRATEARATPRAERSELTQGLAEALDEELAQLPDRYRVAVVLCDLEGKTRQEAARALGWAEGTVASRLARGRAALARRLLRRGLGPAAPAALPSLGPECLPAPLVAVTSRAIAGTVPAPVAALAEGVLGGMSMAKPKLAVMALVLALVASTGGVLAVSKRAGREDAGAKPVPAVRDEAKEDPAALQGTWSAIRVERDGVQAPAEVLKSFKVVIKGNRMTINPDGDNRSSTFKLDPGKKPKWMDNTPHEGPEKGRRLPAIYELNGDTLKICFHNEAVSEKRPTEFKTTAGSGLALLVLKRQRQGGTLANEKEAAVKEELKRLKGTWHCVGLERGGERLEGEAYRARYGPNPIVISGNKLSIPLTKLKIDCTLTIDPTQQPRWMDAKRDSDGLQLFGIYELKDGRLKIYQSGKKRPTELKTRKGTTEVLHIYEKVKE